MQTLGCLACTELTPVDAQGKIISEITSIIIMRMGQIHEMAALTLTRTQVLHPCNYFNRVKKIGLMPVEIYLEKQIRQNIPFIMDQI